MSIGGTDYDIYLKNQILNLNPNFLFIASLYVYGAHPETYPEDWGYWLRDENNERIPDEGWGEYLIDYTLPGAIDHFVQRAKSILDCGLHDGIFMDWWDEGAEFDAWLSHLYHGKKSDALVEIVKRIRAVVGDDFLIIVNTNTRRIPRTATYINGAYMEAIGSVDGYSRERFIEIEEALTWYENNLRYPQVNCFETWGSPKESMGSLRNEQQARASLALSLTHSDGYISNAPGIVSPQHEHRYEIWQGHDAEHRLGIPHGHTHQKYWYDFYDVDLGIPIGEKAQTYNGIDGLFIREFARGWVVYNRSGSEQSIRFESHVSGKSSGFGGTKHIIADLDGDIYLKLNKCDINGDGVVNILDLVIVANAFGETGGVSDVNMDGVVNVLDLVKVANAF